MSEEIKVKKHPIVKGLFGVIRDLLICYITVFVVGNYVTKPIVVHGSSMAPTLEDNSYGFSNVLGYRTSGLKRFDIAIIYYEAKDEYLVKRVIGLPGETISYQNNQLLVDGEYIEEPFLVGDDGSSYKVITQDFGPITLGEEEYFCLGDNRPRSTDSRFYGPFLKEMIQSKGVFILYPFDQIGVKSW